MPVRLSLAFVDIEAHRRTHSGDFLRRLFAVHCDVTDYWMAGPGPRHAVPLRQLNEHDAVFFFQGISPVADLLRLTPPATWAPMYDGEVFNYGYWRRLALANVKALSFCRRLDNWAAHCGLPFLSVQYYMDPAPVAGLQGDPAVWFYWDRGGLPFSVVRRLFHREGVREVIYRPCADPGARMEGPTPQDVQRWNIRTVANDFVSREQLDAWLAEAGVVVCPRRKEGIGMAMVEALARGKCVVAYDEATANEYLTHGETGVLFTFREATPVSPERIVRVRERVLAHAAAGYLRWQRQAAEILPFVLRPADTPPRASACLRLRQQLDYLSIAWRCAHERYWPR